MTVGDGIEVFFEGEADASAMRLNGVIGTAPSADERVLRALLAANYNGQATGGGAIAMDPRTSEIVLTQQIDVTALDADRLAAVLEAFVKYVAFWTGYLPTMAAGRPHAGPAEDTGGAIIRA